MDKASVSRDEIMARKIKENPDYAVKYVQQALEEAIDEEGKQIFLSAVRRVAKIHGFSKIAEAMGVKRESLSRSLSEKGNPRFDTLCDVLQAMGMRLAVEPIQHIKN